MSTQNGAQNAQRTNEYESPKVVRFGGFAVAATDSGLVVFDPKNPGCRLVEVDGDVGEASVYFQGHPDEAHTRAPLAAFGESFDGPGGDAE